MIIIHCATRVLLQIKLFRCVLCARKSIAIFHSDTEEKSAAKSKTKRKTQKLKTMNSSILATCTLHKYSIAHSHTNFTYIHQNERRTMHRRRTLHFSTSACPSICLLVLLSVVGVAVVISSLWCCCLVYFLFGVRLRSGYFT